MSTSIKRRIAKLEGRYLAPRCPPLVVLVGPGETQDEALERARQPWAARGVREFSTVFIINFTSPKSPA